MRIMASLLLSIAVACSSGAAEGDDDDDTGTPDGGAGPTPDGGSGGGGRPDAAEAGVVNPSPTVSAYVGTNVSADLWAADLGHQLKAFTGTLDASGLPAVGQSGTSSTDVGFLLPSGAYTLAWEGTGVVTAGGIGTLRDVVDDGTMHHGTLDVVGTPGAFGRFLDLTITNAAGQSVTALHLRAPGVDAAATFTPQLLRALAPFRALRFMDWQATNGSAMVQWSERATSARFGSQNGVPYELIVELVNQTGKDAWFTVPEKANDDFIAQLAQLVATRLDFPRIQAARDAAGFTTPFRVYVENSNETWNQGFSAFGTFLAAANANPARYTGTARGTYGPAFMNDNSDLMKVGQYQADRLVTIGTAFKGAFGAIGRAEAIAPVLAGWALGPAYSDVGLQFIAAHHGDPKAYVSAVAQAPYFNTPDESTTGSLGPLFGALEASIDDLDARFAEFAALGAEYGLPIVAYEGGQHLTGADNVSVKHLAQHDVRMYDAYVRYLALWKQHFGPSLFMHFHLAGSPGVPESIFQYGFWGSLEGVHTDVATCGTSLPTLLGTEPIASVVATCPKYRALAEQVPGN